MSLEKKAQEQRQQAKKEHQKKLEKSWITNLSSEDDKIVIGALKNIAKNGSIQSGDALLNLLTKDKSEAVEKELIALLKSVKHQDMLDVLMNWIVEDKAPEHTNFLISCIWESGLPAESYFTSLAEVGIKKDYLTLLEVLTVIENYEGSLPEDQIMDVSLSIDEAMESANEQKQALLFSLKEVIHAMG